ncbi:Short-chain dehydrogenase [Sphingomonas laterariae]|uniref:Short-chain dehydrogenase n=1 Tax=Edaphosphingomonas laterariae TaxID=861865 RepID=A0A239CZV1_9SPHN|nr:SDR family NAD(P)-dependent oxidoreductase [Sphingomonas laterariae]SNS25796.1 Short-chain dehydrogenase [Sphingomonas laterariae]
MSLRPLDGKTALVTGASRGIGAATAETLAAAGAHVILTARTPGGLEAVEGRIHEAGGTATIAPMDLTDGESISRLAAAIGGRWPRLDILVLNAAMLGTLCPVPAIDGKEFARVLALNVVAQQAILAAFDPLLRAAEGARVIGITSSVAQRPRAYWAAYAASKAAFENLLLTYGDELANLGDVRVAIVDPGATATRMRAQAFPGEDPATIQPASTVADAILGLLAEDFASATRLRVAGATPSNPHAG